MKSSYIFSLLLAFIFVTGFSYIAEAQESEVSGTVIDAQTEETMAGVIF